MLGQLLVFFAILIIFCFKFNVGMFDDNDCAYEQRMYLSVTYSLFFTISMQVGYSTASLF